MIWKKNGKKYKRIVIFATLVIFGFWFLFLALTVLISNGFVSDFYYNSLIASLLFYGASNLDRLFQPLSSYVEDDVETSPSTGLYLFLAAIFCLYWLVS
jgi:hypothetical protein